MSDHPISPTADRGHTALRGVAEWVEELRRLAYAALPDDELLDLAAVTETVARTLFAVQVAQTDEIDQRGTAGRFACPSTASLLRQLLRIPAKDARVRVSAARAVHARRQPTGGATPPVRPMLGASLDSGHLDRSHILTLLTTMNDLRESLDPEVRDEAERLLVGYAVDLDPDQFRKVAAHLGEIIDPDGTPDQPAAFAKAEFTIGVRNSSTGLTSIRGRLDDLSIESLRVAIDALAAPTAAVDGIKDLRPAATRRAHALVELVHRAVTHTDLPAHGGLRPQISVTMSWDVMSGAIGTAVIDGGVTLSHAAARRLLCDAAVLPAVLGSRGEVLDLGRSSRTFNRATRRAIILRDRGCAPSRAATDHRPGPTCTTSGSGSATSATPATPTAACCAPSTIPRCTEGSGRPGCRRTAPRNSSHPAGWTPMADRAGTPCTTWHLTSEHPPRRRSGRLRDRPPARGATGHSRSGGCPTGSRPGARIISRRGPTRPVTDASWTVCWIWTDWNSKTS